MKLFVSTPCYGILLGTILALPVQSQHRGEPQPAVPPPPIEAPKDIRYPGVMTVGVDATDLDHRIYRTRQTLPVAAAGPMVLLYPHWVPGTHSPNAPLLFFAGLKISAGGKPLAWTRDTVDVYAFHIDVPAEAKTLDIEGQYLTPTDSQQGGIAMTQEILRLNWYAATLYPAGYFIRGIDVDASVKLPAGWQYGTALETATATGDTVKFKRVSYETLVDSPLIAGKYFRKLELDPGGRSRVTLNLAADEPQYLATKPPAETALRELVRQADKLFGARHYDHYDFLLTLSDRLGGMGTEHQRSSDNGTQPKFFTTWDKAQISRDLLPHEYTHSWDGKYRRPADLWTPNLNVPMRDSLLWVYEGQTQYWGHVLAARSGMLTKQQALDGLAHFAASYDAHPGRAWRNLQDTTNDPIIAMRRPIPWSSWQRAEDYYVEGLLVWLEADTLIRERSGGRRSLDDFARAFYGVNDGDWGQLTYTFEEVVATLNKVEPYDWAKFLRARLDENAGGAPLAGIKRGGYTLVFTDTPSESYKDNEARRKFTDLTFSLGLAIDQKGGKIGAVLWDSPAYKAGLTSGQEIIAVNGIAYDADRLKDWVKGSKEEKAPLELLIKLEDVYRVVKIDYHGGARYPHLEPIKGAKALLDDILAPRK
jgi:predicted metalloprotease with PDZ domain